MWQSLWITEKKKGKIGASHRPADLLVGRLRGSIPLFNPVHREPMALPLPEFHQSHFVFFPPLLSLFLSLSKFIIKRRKRFPSFAFSFASHLYFVFTFFSLQERVCGGTTTPQEQFCGASLPTRPILWSVITHKNDFCERQPCPARTTNSRMADLIFTNSHIILLSVWFVCLLQSLSGTSGGSLREQSRK